MEQIFMMTELNFLIKTVNKAEENLQYLSVDYCKVTCKWKKYTRHTNYIFKVPPYESTFTLKFSLTMCPFWIEIKHFPITTHTPTHTKTHTSLPEILLKQTSPVGLQHHTKTNIPIFFFAEWPLKLLHAPSVSSTRRATVLWGNLSPLYQISVQFLIHLRELKKYSIITLMWS